MPWFDFAEQADVSRIGSTGIADFLELRGHERERAFFEFTLESIMFDALETMAGDLDYYQGDLAVGYMEALDDCIRRQGLDDGLAELSSLAKPLTFMAGSEDDLQLEHASDIVGECAPEAAEFPTLEASKRDELLKRTYAHILRAIQLWLEENPESAVPLEYMPNAPTPFADSLVEACLTSPTPADCAREAGVSLP